MGFLELRISLDRISGFRVYGFGFRIAGFKVRRLAPHCQGGIHDISHVRAGDVRLSVLS